MPRARRLMVEDWPFHVTHRGNRQETIFQGDGDRHAYLDLLSRFAAQFEMDIWAYCLMPNHVHLSSSWYRTSSLFAPTKLEPGHNWPLVGQPILLHGSGRTPSMGRSPIRRVESGARTNGQVGSRLSVVQRPGPRRIGPSPDSGSWESVSGSDKRLGVMAWQRTRRADRAKAPREHRVWAANR